MATFCHDCNVIRILVHTNGERLVNTRGMHAVCAVECSLELLVPRVTLACLFMLAMRVVDFSSILHAVCLAIMLTDV